MKMVKPNIRVCRCLWKVWCMGIDGGTGCGGRDEGVCVYGGRDEVWVFVSVWRLVYVCRDRCVCVFINIEMVVLW